MKVVSSRGSAWEVWKLSLLKSTNSDLLVNVRNEAKSDLAHIHNPAYLLGFI